jgi:hypothetical protein
MTRWRFGDTPEDGEAWLRDPSTTFVYVDYDADGAGRPSWRRLVVATKAWVDTRLAQVADAPTAAVWVSMPAMLVLPDVEGEELRRRVDLAVQEGALKFHSVPLSGS